MPISYTMHNIFFAYIIYIIYHIHLIYLLFCHTVVCVIDFDYYTSEHVYLCGLQIRKLKVNFTNKKQVWQEVHLLAKENNIRIHQTVVSKHQI